MDSIFDGPFQLNLMITFLIAFTTALAIVIIARFSRRMRGRAVDLSARQTAHVNPTPRIGGLAVFAALATTVLTAPGAISDPYRDVILASAFLFVVGLLEDIGHFVSPVIRLIAAATASLLVILMLGVWLPRLGIPFLDMVMPLWFVGVPITIFAITGVANGFNLIDGLNGLAALTASTAAIALGLIAGNAGYVEMAHLAFMLTAAILGFAAVNYPFGLIFLGDGGAYTLGFVLGWFGISVVLTVAEVTPWAVFLVMFWPIADTCLAIYRRSARNDGAMTPDRLHMHQLVMRGVEICILGNQHRLLANSLSTIILAPLIISPAIAGVVFWDQPVFAFGAVCLFGLLFVGFYNLGVMTVRKLRRRTETGFVIGVSKS